MDFAKALSEWKQKSPEQVLRSANRVLPLAVAGVLVLAIAHRLAELTWSIAPLNSFDRPAPTIVQPTSPQRSGRDASSFRALRGSELFGPAPAEAPSEPAPVNAELEAPDTTLGIQLTGVIADEAGRLSQAIIATGRGEERKYALGEDIEGTNGATLHAVYRNRVILNRGGRLETLRLPQDAAAAGQATAQGRSAPAASRAPAAATPSSDASRQGAPSSLTDIMRMAPHMEGGQMVGFRVNPGRDRDTFRALGLEPGDIVTDINGVTLDDPSRALQVFEALGESTQANVTVQRDGQSTVLVVDTSQVQSLVEGRQ